MSHTRKTPPIKYTTSTLPTDVNAGTVALDTTTNEQKVFNGSTWDNIEGGFGTSTVVFDSTGPSYDQIKGDIPTEWKQFDASLKGLVIGTTCKIIGDRAFSGCSGLSNSFVIPSSVTTIGKSVFRSCSFSGNLIIPDSVKEIGDFCFYDCQSLNGSLTIGRNVSSFGYAVFWYCNFTNLNSYITKDILTSSDSNFLWLTNISTIHVRATDPTWTAGGGQTIGGKTGITVIKDL